jgi:hypothetical protein
MGSPAVSPPPGMPPTPQTAAPAPTQPSPQVEKGSRSVIQVVQLLRGLAQDFPAASPEIREINDKLRQVQLKIMQNSQPGEAAAPPMNG